MKLKHRALDGSFASAGFPSKLLCFERGVMFHTRTSAHWNTVEHIGTRWNLVDHNGTQWHTVKHGGTRWNTLSVLASVPPLHVHEFTLNIFWLQSCRTLAALGFICILSAASS